MNDKRLEELFARYYEQTATAGETAELMDLVRQAGPDRLSELIRRHGEALEDLAPVTRPEEAEAIFQAIIGQAEQPRRISWRPLAAAAIIIGLLATAAFWLIRSNRPQAPAVASPAAVADIRPARERAVLLLDDSSAIGLDTLANGRIQQRGSSFTHTNGQLVYAAGAEAAAPVYNTIATGKGNFYSLVLSDGTKVWLNAASSLRFPVAFGAAERAVEVKGEAYFEVAKDAARPFRVKLAGEGMVEVLGTHFNVNAYPERATRTTLLEGAVKVTRGGSSRLLKPGQQAVLAEAGVEVKINADLEQVMAWKAGYFWFENTPIREIMAEAARWYDVEVRYAGTVTEEGFSGKISREAPLSRLLQVLELNGITVKTNGKTITIQ